MLLFASLLSVLSADPTAVMVQSRSGMAPDELKKALTTLDVELARLPGAWSLDETQERLKAVPADASSCAGKLPCLLDLATKVKARWLVTVSVSKIGRDRAWALAAVESVTGTQLTAEEWLDETNADISAPVSSFVKRLAPLLVVKDAPVAVKLDPTPPPPPPEPGPAVVAEASRPLPKVLVISGAVVAAVAVGLAVGAGVTAAPLNQVTTSGGLTLSSLTKSEADQLKQTANTLTGAAIAAGVVAAGLGVGAVLTW
ncbi:MAG: hypothetical protein Q8N26_33360 [Myxococcales bacterium]|nr:hypothetical protein [Myxococcales bacterium]